MFVVVKIWDCHGNRLRAGLAVCMPLTEAWTSTSLTGRCGRIVTLLDENREKSGVRSPDEHSNNSRTTSCRSGSSCTVWVSSGGTGFPTMGGATSVAPVIGHCRPSGRQSHLTRQIRQHGALFGRPGWSTVAATLGRLQAPGAPSW